MFENWLARVHPTLKAQLCAGVCALVWAIDQINVNRQYHGKTINNYKYGVAFLVFHLKSEIEKLHRSSLDSIHKLPCCMCVKTSNKEATSALFMFADIFSITELRCTTSQGVKGLDWGTMNQKS